MRCSLVLLFACLSFAALAEIFSSIANLEQLIHSEIRVADYIDAYVEQEQKRLAALKQICKDYRNHNVVAGSDVTAYLSNPVNAYITVKLFTSDWTKVVDSVETSAINGKAMLDEVDQLHPVKPSKEDLVGAVNALLRLQDVYKLSTNQIATGTLKGVLDSPQLSVEECYEIARQAYNEEDYYHSSLWFQHVLDSSGSDIPNGGINKVSLLDHLAFSTYQQGNVRYALNLTEVLVGIDPEHERAKNNIFFYKKEISESHIPEDSNGQPQKGNRKLDEYRQSQEFKDYEALCRDEKIKTYKHAHKLHCRFVHTPAMFRLVPLKEEVLYLDPRLVVFHDFITDAEIDKVKQLAKPRLHRSTVFVKTDSNNNLTQRSYRTSQSAWLKDQEDPLIRSISLKSAAASSLSLDTVEDLQVLNYGIGGHYEPHYDFARSYERDTFKSIEGNRIATILYYMTDVEAGGSTAFIQMGVNVKPKKGSCAMWYNLRRNGDGDMKTKHAACPVLVGQKWVCNKWFHERSQEFKRPCSLNPKM